MSPHGISQSSNLERIVRGNHNFKACIERSGGQRQQIAPDAAVLCRRRLNTRTEQRKQNDEFDFLDWSIFVNTGMSVRCRPTIKSGGAELPPRRTMSDMSGGYWPKLIF